MSQEEPPAKIFDPAKSDDSRENARNGAAAQRDRAEPAAVVGLGASAGGVSVLQEFFEGMLPESGLAFVVVMHLSPDHESNLAAVLQQKTSMPVIQVKGPEKLRPNHVYVIPPNRQLVIEDSTLNLVAAQQALGRRVTIDLFFRTLAYSYGQRSVCVILSGSDSDGVIGLKHIRAQGGVTMAQDPREAQHDSMPMTAISTGMVDWVLPVAQMPAKLLDFVRNEERMQLPPEIPEADEPDAKVADAPGGETVSEETRDPEDESALHEVLLQLRSQTGHDFTHYKRATVLRRVARRLQVNSQETIPQYLEFLRRHPAEARALFQDLLIGVTHFFRDQAAFAALEANVPQLFAGKKREDQIRVWVPGCATGEEAYSIAMLLCEYAERLEAPPSIQVFATDIDEAAVHEARDGLYPSTIEADVSLERLRRFFLKEQSRYRVRKDLRERVLFASHNLLGDAPFSRLDLVSCRNLLIYLNSKAQAQVFDLFHFALRRGGLLFIGNSETSDPGHTLFTALDPKQRVFVRRSVARPAWTVPMLPIRAPAPNPRFPLTPRPRTLLPLQRPSLEDAASVTAESSYAGQERRSVLFGELHLKMLEQYGPPSVVVNEAHDIVHLSENAGRYLHFVAGEPTANLIKVVHPSLRIELRTALFRAAQTNENVSAPGQRIELDGGAEMIDLQVRPLCQADEGTGFFLVVFETQKGPVPPRPIDSLRETTDREMDDEVQFLKSQLNSTIEQYETANEELKASNEEFQAMNEELRSATEELETSKEELQSVNEEMSTVNHELKTSVEELSSANADLNNLMASTDIGTIFLDRQLRVKRFTPSAQTVFNILPADLHRPLSDITNKLAYPNFTQDAEKVLEGLHTIEREVRLGEQRWFLTRIAPYRTADDHIAGIVATFIDITRRKQAEEGSRAGDRRYRTLFDLVPAAVYSTDAEGVIQEFNRQAVDLWGRTPEKGEKFCGSFKIFTPDGTPMPHHECPMARVLHGESLSPSDCELVVEQADGGRKNVSVAPSALKNERGEITGAINCLYDITARKQSEEALRSSEERFRLLVEGARDYAMFLLDPGNIITFWSVGAERVFGWTQDEAVGQFGAMIFTPEDRRNGEVEKEINGALNDGRALDRRFHLRKDGSRLWTDGVLMRLDDESGKLRGFAKVARDATDQRRIEDELLHARDEMEQRVVERTRELLAMNNELEQTMAQRQQLERELLEISEREKRRIGEDLHDMVCQELTATALYLKSSAKKLAKESPAASATLEESAQTVNRNVVLARELAGGLQAVELTASGLKNALRDLAAQASDNAGIKCHFKAARGVRVPDDTVALHLYRIAQEAVTNAVKHSGAKNILISLDRNPTHTCVTVQDDGKGFVVKKRGKGLGLHMMRYRANALGGELKIGRRRTGGMEITCVIPTEKV
jgi:two-component system CheB/CheR fusion protein